MLDKDESLLGPSDKDDRHRLVISTKRGIYRSILDLNAEAAVLIETNLGSKKEVAHSLGNFGKMEVKHG